MPISAGGARTKGLGLRLRLVFVKLIAMGSDFKECFAAAD
jgi:hypothetical protein